MKKHTLRVQKRLFTLYIKVFIKIELKKHREKKFSVVDITGRERDIILKKINYSKSIVKHIDNIEKTLRVYWKIFAVKNHEFEYIKKTCQKK